MLFSFLYFSIRFSLTRGFHPHTAHFDLSSHQTAPRPMLPRGPGKKMQSYGCCISMLAGLTSFPAAALLRVLPGGIRQKKFLRRVFFVEILLYHPAGLGEAPKIILPVGAVAAAVHSAARTALAGIGRVAVGILRGDGRSGTHSRSTGQSPGSSSPSSPPAG